MSADITWFLSGVDARRWKIQRASMWRPPVSVRGTSVQVPGRHGSIAAGLPVFEAPTVSLEMLLVGDQVSLEEAQAELVGLLSAPGLVLGRSSGGVVTEGEARLVSISPSGFVAERSARFEVLLTIPGVFLRGTEVDSFLAPGTGAVPGLSGSTAPVGDALLRVQGPQNPVITDVVSGTGVSWEASMNDSWYLFVDLATMRASLSQDAENWSAVAGGGLVVRENLHPDPRYIGPDGTSGSVTWDQEDEPSGAPDGGPRTQLTATSDASGQANIGNDLSARVPVTGGETYTISTYVQGSRGGLPLRMRMNFFDSGGSNIGNTQSSMVPLQTGADGVRIDVTATAPASAVEINVMTVIEYNPGVDPVVLTGDIVSVSMRMVEHTDVLDSYFDGGTEDTSWAVNDWTGPENESPSTQTITPTAATSALDYPPAGRLQLWPRMSGSDPGVRDAVVTVAGATEVVVRARPAYL